MNQSNDKIPVVECPPVILSCDKGESGHTTLINTCPSCDELVRVKLNQDLQLEAERLKRR